MWTNHIWIKGEGNKNRKLAYLRPSLPLNAKNCYGLFEHLWRGLAANCHSKKQRTNSTPPKFALLSVFSGNCSEGANWYDLVSGSKSDCMKRENTKNWFFLSNKTADQSLLFISIRQHGFTPSINSVFVFCYCNCKYFF